MKINLLLIIFLPSIIESGHTKEEWRTRAVYQIITDRFSNDDSSRVNCDLSKYCGGTYKGIIKNLDYIQGMGFDAIWISPIIENTQDSYHGYHLTNLYKFNNHFGTEFDLINLIKECHKRDIWVMLDVVANHVGPVGNDFSRITPFNKKEYYHDDCEINNWNDQWQVENCRLSGLPDLKQEHPYVKNKLIEWIHDIILKFDLDGIRIDTVPEVPKWFWTEFTKAAGVFQIGEVFNGNIDYVSQYQNHMDSVFNYPLYYQIKNSFCGDMRNIENYLYNMRNKYPHPEYIGTFVENHDNARFINMCNSRKKFKNALIFSIFFEGIPFVYYGGEQYFGGGSDPYNREVLWHNFDTNIDMYKALGAANKVRKEKKIWEKPFVQRYSDDVFYAFTRGDVLVCVTRGESCSRKITFHEFSNGSKLCDALNTYDCVYVENNEIQINMGEDPKVYVKM